jgi:hypothetical protein
MIRWFGRVFEAEERGEGRIVAGRLERQAEERGARNRADAVRAAGEFGPVHQDDADDLAEAERHDRQVVAAQAQRRPAEKDAEAGCHRAGNRQRLPEGPAELGRQEAVGVGADGVEGDVTEIEQAGQADDDVQAPAEHDVDQHRGRGIDDVAVVGEDDRQHQRDAECAQPIQVSSGLVARLRAPAAATACSRASLRSRQWSRP